VSASFAALPSAASAVLAAVPAPAP
jgi:hypothetical protein